jgi:hypothetical protein
MLLVLGWNFRPFTKVQSTNLMSIVDIPVIVHRTYCEHELAPPSFHVTSGYKRVERFFYVPYIFSIETDRCNSYFIDRIII